MTLEMTVLATPPLTNTDNHLKERNMVDVLLIRKDSNPVSYGWCTASPYGDNLYSFFNFSQVKILSAGENRTKSYNTYWEPWVHGFPRSLCVQGKDIKDFLYHRKDLAQ